MPHLVDESTSRIHTYYGGNDRKRLVASSSSVKNGIVLMDERSVTSEMMSSIDGGGGGVGCAAATVGSGRHTPVSGIYSTTESSTATKQDYSNTSTLTEMEIARIAIVKAKQRSMSTQQSADDVSGYLNGNMEDCSLDHGYDDNDVALSTISSLPDGGKRGGGTEAPPYVPWFASPASFAYETIASVRQWSIGGTAPSSLLDDVTTSDTKPPPQQEEQDPEAPNTTASKADDDIQQGKVDILTNIFGGAYATVSERLNNRSSDEPIRTYHKQSNSHDDDDDDYDVPDYPKKMDPPCARVYSGLSIGSNHEDSTVESKVLVVITNSGNHATDDDDEENSSALVGKSIEIRNMKLSSSSSSSTTTTPRPNKDNECDGVYAVGVFDKHGIVHSRSFRRTILALGCLILLCILLAVGATLLLDMNSSSTASSSTPEQDKPNNSNDILAGRDTTPASIMPEIDTLPELQEVPPTTSAETYPDDTSDIFVSSTEAEGNATNSMSNSTDPSIVPPGNFSEATPETFVTPTESANASESDVETNVSSTVSTEGETPSTNETVVNATTPAGSDTTSNQQATPSSPNNSSQQNNTCEDDSDFLFQVGNVELNCLWLSEQPKNTAKVLCDTLGEDVSGCPKTCGLCN